MPDVQELPEDVASIASTAEEDHQVELLLAGFRACAKEAIRFLLEEEGLAPDHALPVGLEEHLNRQQTHLAGMLQTDSGLDIDESMCCSSPDDRSFLLPHDLLHHADSQQTFVNETFQKDSLYKIDERFSSSSADDSSFITSEPSDVGYNTETSTLNDSSISNASIQSLPESGTGNKFREECKSSHS